MVCILSGCSYKCVDNKMYKKIPFTDVWETTYTYEGCMENKDLNE